MKTTRRSALFALAAAGLIWGLTVPLSKLALGWLDPAWLTVARFGLAAPVLAWVARAHLREALSPAIAAWGAAGFGMVVVLQNAGIERTSVSHAALIVGAVPALVALVSAAIGRGTAGRLAWLGFAIALAGVGLVAGTGAGASAAGDALVFGSAVLAAAFIVAQKPLLRGRDAVAVTAVQMAAAALAALPVALLAGALPAAPPSGTELGAFAALATVGSLLPFALYAYGQSRVTAEVAGAFVNLEPLVGATAGALVFGDAFGAAHVLGAAAIVGGIALSLRSRVELGGDPRADLGRARERLPEGDARAPATYLRPSTERGRMANSVSAGKPTCFLSIFSVASAPTRPLSSGTGRIELTIPIR